MCATASRIPGRLPPSQPQPYAACHLVPAAAQDHLYARMAAAALEGERFAESTLAFANLLLFSGPLPPPRGAAVVPVNEDDLLQALRDALLPAVDVNPVSFS